MRVEQPIHRLLDRLLDLRQTAVVRAISFDLRLDDRDWKLSVHHAQRLSANDELMVLRHRKDPLFGKVHRAEFPLFRDKLNIKLKNRYDRRMSKIVPLVDRPVVE